IAYSLAKNLATCIDSHDVPLLREPDTRCTHVMATCATSGYDTKNLYNYIDRYYTKAECRYLCAATEKCTQFVHGYQPNTGSAPTSLNVGDKRGHCYLFKDTCTPDNASSATQKGYNLNACPVQGKVCPAVFGGGCLSNNLYRSHSVTRVEQASGMVDTPHSDYDVQARFRGYHRMVGAIFHNHGGGLWTSFYQYGCMETQDQYSGFRLFHLQQNDVMCKQA
ncbi:unnamed protein product, partial [Amoebophrya sp. A120]